MDQIEGAANVVKESIEDIDDLTINLANNS